MTEKITSKHYTERAIKNLESLFNIPEGYSSPVAREIVQDIVSAAILATAEIQKEAMESLRQIKKD